jgi:hypothetical protein
MKFLLNRRRLAGLAVVGAAVAATLFVVLPALASSPADLVNPPSTGAGVLPYDAAFGGNGACSNLFTGAHALGAGIHEYDNNNPKTATNVKSGNGDGVTFDLTLHNPSNTSQTLDVFGHGAAILGIGIKGGTQTTAYDYLHPGPVNYPGGSVTFDTGLHAPLQNNSYTTSGGVETGSTFYSISLLNVCYAALSYIQGTVYQDNNQNGANDGQPNAPTCAQNSSVASDCAQQGWTVNLYSGVTQGVKGGGTLVKSLVTGPDGKYHFDVAATGTTYRVCEVPSGDTPLDGGSTWVQSQPRPSTNSLCNGTGELAKGYDFTPTSTTGATDDFSNVGGIPCSSAGAQVNGASGAYTVGTCKGGQLYVFNSGTNANGVPFIDYWVGDPSQDLVPTVEQINFDDPFDLGSPRYTKLLYADGGGFPPNLNTLSQMPNCLLDPRDPENTDGFSLATAYQDKANAGQVIPNFSVANNQTSCVISIKVTAPQGANNPGKLQAYVYALGDSLRGAGH